MGFRVEETYPSHTKAVTNVDSKLQLVHSGVRMLTVKNGAQQITKIIKTTPKTLEAFCSVRTELSLLTLAYVLEEGGVRDGIGITGWSSRFINKMFAALTATWCLRTSSRSRLGSRLEEEGEDEEDDEERMEEQQFLESEIISEGKSSSCPLQ